MGVRESGLVSTVTELLAANRQPDNPVLQFSPVGRVPALVAGDLVITEARHVFDYLAEASGSAYMQFHDGNDWMAISQEGQILGFVDGIANWVRENRREPDKRSKFLIDVEIDRSGRCLSYLENEAASLRLPDFPAFRSLALAAGLGLMDFHRFFPDWRSEYQTLSTWFERQEGRASMKETAPA